MNENENLALLKAQQAALDAQIADTKARVLKDVIAQTRFTIAEFGLTAKQLFPKSAAKAKTVAYRDSKGNTWAGGRGRVPNWVKEVKAANDDIERYRCAA
jgi:DNA-binding protein H-NS